MYLVMLTNCHGHNLLKRIWNYLKQYTNDCVLVMGRATFNSLPCKLRNLQHYVITTQTDIKKITNKKGNNPDYIGNNIEDVCLHAAAYSSLVYKKSKQKIRCMCHWWYRCIKNKLLNLLMMQ